MPRPSPDFAARTRGALLGALAGGGEDPLREILADELAEGHTDLRRLAERWVERYRADPRGLEAETAAALEFLGTHHAPPPVGGSGGGALGRVLPVALVACRSPRTLVSATYHIAALTHPAPEAAWGAVAVNVALGRLLVGARDFVADVIEALAGNGAPETLLRAVRRVPLQRRDGLPVPLDPAPAASVELALGLAYHEPIAGRGLDWLRKSGLSAAGAAAGALLGARDGSGEIPSRFYPAEGAARWSALADRLVRRAPVPAPAD